MIAAIAAIFLAPLVKRHQQTRAHAKNTKTDEYDYSPDPTPDRSLPEPSPRKKDRMPLPAPQAAYGARTAARPQTNTPPAPIDTPAGGTPSPVAEQAPAQQHTATIEKLTGMLTRQHDTISELQQSQREIEQKLTGLTHMEARLQSMQTDTDQLVTQLDHLASGPFPAKIAAALATLPNQPLDAALAELEPRLQQALQLGQHNRDQITELQQRPAAAPESTEAAPAAELASEMAAWRRQLGKLQTEVSGLLEADRTQQPEQPPQPVDVSSANALRALLESDAAFAAEPWQALWSGQPTLEELSLRLLTFYPPLNQADDALLSALSGWLSTTSAGQLELILPAVGNRFDPGQHDPSYHQVSKGALNRVLAIHRPGLCRDGVVLRKAQIEVSS